MRRDGRTPAPSGGAANQPRLFVRTTAAAAAIILVAKALSFLRDVVMADKYGTSDYVSAFFGVAAVQALTVVVASDALALSSTKHAATDPHHTSSILRSGLLLGLALAAMQFVSARSLASAVSHEAMVQQTQAFRLAAPATFGLVVLSTQAGIASAKHRFLVPHIVGVVWSAIALGGVVIFEDAATAIITSWSLAIAATALGWVLVTDRQALAAGPLSRTSLLTAGPLVLAGALNQTSFLAERIAAQRITTSASAELGYAYKAVFAPIGLMLTAISTQVLPSLLGASAHGKRGVVVRTGKITLALAVVSSAVSILLATFAEPLVALLYERGEFDQEATQRVSSAVRGYSLTALVFPLSYVLVRHAVAAGAPFRPAAGAACGLFATVALLAGLGFDASVEKVAWATSVGNTAMAAYLLVCLAQDARTSRPRPTEEQAEGRPHAN